VHVAEVIVNELGHIAGERCQLWRGAYTSSESTAVDKKIQKGSKKALHHHTQNTCNKHAISGRLCITASHHITMQAEANTHLFSIVINKLHQIATK
jgi:hypothetical protein